MWSAFPLSPRPNVPPFAPWTLLHLFARMGTSDFRCVFGLPPGLPVVPPYPLSWRNASDLPSSRQCLVDVPRSLTPMGPRRPWSLAPPVLPSTLLTVSAPTVNITRLNPFTLSHCGPSTPCVRFAAVVTFDYATLGTLCLTRASGSGAFPLLTSPNFARRTSRYLELRSPRRMSSRDFKSCYFQTTIPSS